MGSAGGTVLIHGAKCTFQSNPKVGVCWVAISSSSQTLVFLGNPLRNRKFGLYGDSTAGFEDRHVEKM